MDVIIMDGRGTFDHRLISHYEFIMLMYTGLRIILICFNKEDLFNFKYKTQAFS